MRALEHMNLVLEGTGLYHPEENQPLRWELAAYDAGFSLLEERFDKLLGDLFVATASREQLARWEALFRDQPALGDGEDSRETLLRRFSTHPDDFTPQAVEAILPAAGVRGKLLENGKNLVVLLGRLLGVNKSEAARELDQLLPSHLPWSWDESITWVALGAYAVSFQDWDGLGLTWEGLEAITRQDLETNFLD